jgi:hypothetical protein
MTNIRENLHPILSPSKYGGRVHDLNFQPLTQQLNPSLNGNQTVPDGIVILVFMNKGSTLEHHRF